MTMSTISFQDPITTNPPPTLRRQGRLRRPRFHSTDNYSNSDVRAEATTEPHSQRRNRKLNDNAGHRHRNKNRSSIHLSIPPIQDRDSSLYSYQAPPLPYYDWSKSCSDLTTRNIFPNSAASTNTSCGCQSNLNQSIFGSPYTTPSTALEINNNIEWCQSTLDLSSISDNWAFKLDNHNTIDITSEVHERHQFTRCPSPEPTPRSYNYNDTTQPLPRSSTPDRKWPTRLGLAFRKKSRTPKLLAMSSSEHTPIASPAPVVPPRSELRKPSQTLPNSGPSSTRPSLSERGSSLYVLEVGAPLVQTPSLSSGSESEDLDTSRVAPNMARRSIFDENVFGKKRIGTDRDPLKVRDGLGPRESPSGVYTPPTFPGACGPRPAQYPTHVYTPTNFQLYPTPSSADPSRSSSTATSSNEDLPQTPISPTLRMFSNKTMAGIRRISGSLASIDPRQSPTPASNRDSYFSYSSTSSRQSSWGPISPNSINFPAGLGVGLAEKEGLTATKCESSPMMRRPTEEIKIKRKPVPSAEVDNDSDELADGIKRVSITHAL